ncbi:MAG: hypothetical protein IJJ06_03640 [Mogibacterium sp.]|nr:hypothetical protein [Mogibacterium sp.]
MAEKSNNGEVTFEIKEFIGALDAASDNGWRRELNLVSWNGGAPKLDIREWSPDHTRMSRGITMSEEQGIRVAQLLAQRAREKQRQSAERDSFER